MTIKKLLKNKFIWAGLILAVVMAFAPVVVNAQFDIKEGIIGNLFNKDCAQNGNCGFCDWINLFVVLQKVILSLFGGLALLLLVWGGQGLITAGGNEENIKKSKDLITSTIIGVVIILAGYFIVNVILVLLLTKPEKGSLPTDQLFNSNWMTAFCADPNSTGYCADQKKAMGEGFKDGQVACGLKGDFSKVCRGTSCVNNCAFAAAQPGTKIVGCKVVCGSGETPKIDYFCPTDSIGPTPVCCEKTP